MPLPDGYRFITAKADYAKYIGAIYEALTTHPGIYWSTDRTLDIVTRQIDRAWACVCVVKVNPDGKERLIAFCRIISDGEGFGYLCDVYVLPEHQKKGIAGVMVKEAVDNTGGEGVSAKWNWILWTKDAHKLYTTAAGFKTCPTNGWAMDRFYGV